MYGEIISKLINGDKQIVDDFVRAKYIWDKFFDEKGISTDDISNLSRNFLYQDAAFTEEFGNRLGVRLFVLSGLYQFYPFGGNNETLAKKLLQGIQDSSISSESKMLFVNYGKVENLI
ncbi:hypothetical protein GMB86_06000 [Terrilactibacillus sp. BCM23-1]|uniref:Uncharacterized protein n=1 Tax=Terrilactibacillus tamarindi TaxID=2599694 RepID=A0A6N8CU40_9BACI|nr:hypothetical protein [Terrilactibacillus tamarindi]MTT31566.1 hypothetical protein [Terrilactibacillus tamarindi]